MRRFDAFQSLTISNDFNEINVVTNALAVSENDIFTNTLLLQNDNHTLQKFQQC